MSKPPRHCIFCGRKGASKEHVWPAWLSEVLPPRRFPVGSSHPISMNGGRQTRGMMERPGDILSRKLRVVCEPCNNGWMSGVQSQAKGCLSKLVLDDWTELKQSDFPALITWIVMFAMVAEQAQPRLVATTEETRRAFMLDRRPPDGWAIWIGRYPGEYFIGGIKPGFAHRGGYAALVAPDKDENPKFNTIMVSGCVGSFFFVAAGSSFDTIQQRIADAAAQRPSHAIRLWPGPSRIPREVPRMSKAMVDSWVFSFRDALFT